MIVELVKKLSKASGCFTANLSIILLKSSRALGTNSVYLRVALVIYIVNIANVLYGEKTRI